MSQRDTELIPTVYHSGASHHCVVSGVLGDAQTSVIESRTRVQTLR